MLNINQIPESIIDVKATFSKSSSLFRYGGTKYSSESPAKAYKLLENDGYIVSNVGRGSYVSDKLTKDCAERAMALDDFKQSTKIANLLSVDKAELNRIIENIYNGGGIDD